TDVIVGFPGETDDDFAGTCNVLEQVGFCKIHVFTYSPREGTHAAVFPERVPPDVMARRREYLRALEEKMAAAYARSLTGRTLDVLVEGADPKQPGHVLGTSCRYVPVSFPGLAPALVGHRFPVRAGAWQGSTILGEPEVRQPSLDDYNPNESTRRFALPLA